MNQKFYFISIIILVFIFITKEDGVDKVKPLSNLIYYVC